MSTFKVTKRIQVQDVNEDGKEKFLLVKRGKGKMLTIPCYHLETETVADNLSFQDAKKMRNENKSLQIVIE